MAETPADVRRDIEMTRERISDTLQQLEAKANLMQIVKDHPWPALGVAVGAGFLLSGSRADVKAAGATLVATKGASSKLGTVLDDVVSNLMGGLSLAFQQRVESLVDELKGAIGAPTGTQGAAGAQHFAGGRAGASGTAAEYGASHATGGMAAATSNSGAASSTGMGALGNATQGGSGSLTPSSAGSQSLGARNRADDVGSMGGSGSWAPQSSGSDHVPGLGGTPGATPRAD